MKKSIGSGRGSVYNILLKALQSGDKYGYEICKEVEEKTNGTYILKQASLYSGLKRLETQGDITSYWRDSALGGRRHYYSLTDKGRDRINRSDFSWTDARDDIVETLFEKTEIEKQIDEVSTEINELKDISKANEQNIKNYDEVIEQTQNLIDEQEKSQNEFENEKDESIENDKSNNQANYSSHINTNSDDLFSMFSHFDSNQNDNENENLNDDAEKDFDEDEMIEEKVDEETIDDEIEQVENAEENIEQDKQLELNEYDQNQIKNQFDNQQTQNFQNQQSQFVKIFENDNNIKKENEQLDLFSFVNQNTNELKNVEETQKDENENNTVENIENQLRNQNYEQQNIDNLQININQSKTKELEKNNENFVDEYKKTKVSLNRFSDSTQFELPEKEFYNYENTFDFSKEETQNNFGFDKIDNFDDELTNIQKNEKNNEFFEKNNKIFENSSIIFENNYQNTENIQNTDDGIINNDFEKNIIVEDKNDNSTSFDYHDIFGDLVSVKEKNDLQNSPQMQEEKNDAVELPKNENVSHDINRTLLFNRDEVESKIDNSSSVFEKYDDTFEKYDNPFEKYDTYTEPENYFENYPANNQPLSQAIHKERTRDISFDKKYANDNNNFDVPDYEVRYYKKRNATEHKSKFISINKLNLIASSIMCLFVYIMTTLTIVCAGIGPNTPSFQIFLYVTSYVLAVLILLFDFVKYLLNKNLKVLSLNPNQKLNNWAFGIILLIVSITVNIVAGLNFENFANYIASVFLPIWYFAVIVLSFPLKKFLSRFANFYS